MNFTMITPYHNHDTGYISLILKDFIELPAEVTVDGKILVRKGEFHVSLMALKNILPLITALNPSVTERDLEQDFLKYQKGTELSEYIPTTELRHVVRGDRETVIGMVKVPGLEGLFAQLRAKYGVAIPTQPTHITLYTLQPEVGIGITSHDQLATDTKVIDLPNVKLVAK